MSSEVKIVVEWQVWEGERATTFADALLLRALLREVGESCR